MHCCCLDVQLRRSRAWFPCVDEPLAACPYELHFTVAAKHMAISCGTLTKQSWSDGGSTRTFHYKLDIPTPPQDISLAVGELTASHRPDYKCVFLVYHMR